MYLVIKGRTEPVRNLQLEAGRDLWLIGREPSCDVILSASQVSRRHARLIFDGGQFFIEDCGSALGTVIGNVQISARESLSVGRRIRIGSYELFLSVEKVSDEPEPAEQKEPPRNNAASQNTAAIQGKFIHEYRNANLLYSDEMMALKRRIHERVLAEMHLVDMKINVNEMQKTESRRSLERALNKVLRELWHELPRNISVDIFKEALVDELINYGPISSLLRDPEIDEIMVNGPNLIFVEKQGKLYETGIRFFNERHLISIIQRIVEPLGRHVDEASPMVDARLPDGSRVNAIIPPLALDGASVTIRKFATRKLTTEDLVKFGTMTQDIADFMAEAVKARQNIVISGGTGSGKTTLLNVLSQFIPLEERLVTIEDSAELQLSHRNLVRLESRPANIEGRGRIAIRDLLVNSLRMRPDRIIIGECRSGEALDMLQAMNTGHDGSLTTVHANSPRDALSRLENMVLMAGFELPVSAIREQVASAVNLVIQQNRLADGTRKITQISEVVGREGNVVTMQDIFVFHQEGVDADGKVIGRFSATGNVPRFVEILRQRGRLNLDMAIFSQNSRFTAGGVK
ncbi:MAG: Flp pilus assembly complex ATPase component TadA [Lentisphaeria bacterium]|nr:Flp pilus assembly complex ATPase component TadA [Lentisphaeria bacterium]